MLVAIPEVPETSHQGSTSGSGTPLTTTSSSNDNNNGNNKHLKTISVKHCSLLMAPTTEPSETPSGYPTSVSPGSPGAPCPMDVSGLGGTLMEGLIKREMKPPVSVTIPKSRNHRRTPPTPPTHSPSPPTLTPPPCVTSPSSTTPMSHTESDT
ncbi:hypothetical protein SK128_022777, partial [Halocaridina rubra]